MSRLIIKVTLKAGQRVYYHGDYSRLTPVKITHVWSTSVNLDNNMTSVPHAADVQGASSRYYTLTGDESEIIE